MNASLFYNAQYPQNGQTAFVARFLTRAWPFCEYLALQSKSPSQHFWE